MVQIRHEHSGRLDIENSFAAGLDLLDGRCIEVDGRLGWPANRPGLGAASRTTLAIAMQRNSAIFGMDGPVVPKQQIAANEGAAAFQAFEGTLFGVGALMSASMLTPAESTIAELAFVLSLRSSERGLSRCGC
jgi:hypothetical protein